MKPHNIHLLPCPFCGQTASFQEALDGHGCEFHPARWQVSCNKCDGSMNSLAKSKEEAADNWNCSRQARFLESKTFVARDGETQLESASEDEVRDFAEVAKCNGVRMKLFCREFWMTEYELPENP